MVTAEPGLEIGFGLLQDSTYPRHRDELFFLKDELTDNTVPVFISYVTTGNWLITTVSEEGERIIAAMQASVCRGCENYIRPNKHPNIFQPKEYRSFWIRDSLFSVIRDPYRFRLYAPRYVVRQGTHTTASNNSQNLERKLKV